MQLRTICGTHQARHTPLNSPWTRQQAKFHIGKPTKKIDNKTNYKNHSWRKRKKPAIRRKRKANQSWRTVTIISVVPYTLSTSILKYNLRYIVEMSSKKTIKKRSQTTFTTKEAHPHNSKVQLQHPQWSHTHWGYSSYSNIAIKNNRRHIRTNSEKHKS